MQTTSDYFGKLVGMLRMADYEFLMQSPDCTHEIWRRYENFISVPRMCKSRHAANAILKAIDFPYQF
ncbi:MAG: hypothetical protein H6R01_1472 [Burkholderiaceae bacterium]|nr:hypothetical protein [Burkholderiaceae bacterium]